MTNEEYRQIGGAGCPTCESDQIEGGFFEVNGDESNQKMSCADCHSIWFDHYHLKGFYGLETAQEQKLTVDKRKEQRNA